MGIPSNLDFLRAAAARGIPFQQKVSWATGDTPTLTIQPKADWIMFIDKIQSLPSGTFVLDGTDKLEIIGLTAENIYYTGTAQGDGGGDDTIKLATTASAVDSTYNTLTIDIVGGTGKGQTKTTNTYVGSTRIATLDTDWTTKPDDTSIYKIRGKSQFANLDEITVSLNSKPPTDGIFIYLPRPPIMLKESENDSLIIKNSGGTTQALTGTIIITVFGWTLPETDW